MTKKKAHNDTENTILGSGGFLGGLANIIEKLDELAKTGASLKEVSELHGKDAAGKEIKGVFGYNVKFGLGKNSKNDISIEPFGNLHKDKHTGAAVMQDVLEPIVDVFEEATHTLVVAELPGIGAQDVKLDLNGEVLTLHAAKGKKKYCKEITLPHSYVKEKVTIISCNNGILEIKCIL
ncbi:MAG: hypothetical protein A3F46_02630 [Legionellales bacterium RIFCSPHIGHO2_12_FULL_42_9]|nr:MAG: hypothetical protein A3F46_02630 [Legionellales bacterium RIFCSPHIGHO2_12_FULL_42_9]